MFHIISIIQYNPFPVNAEFLIGRKVMGYVNKYDCHSSMSCVSVNIGANCLLGFLYDLSYGLPYLGLGGHCSCEFIAFGPHAY